MKHKTLNDLRIIFLGTPAFAVASLNKLVEAGCNIIAVITAPDKPAGRGLTIQQTAVKEYAVDKGITVLQPDKLKDPVFVETLRSLNADLQVVVAFRMLPEVVWNMPPLGTINVHGSLLPQYRGAAPINWAIINGEKITGVTTFKLRHAIDTGDILLKTSLSIGEDETAGELHDRMKEAGAQLLLETLNGICNETLKPVQQENISERELKHAPKLTAATGELDFNKTKEQLHDLIRGLSPVPAAYTSLKGKKLKIFKSQKVNLPSAEAGSFETDEKSYLRFACSNGWISILELQLEGKKKLCIVEFLRGYRFQ